MSATRAVLATMAREEWRMHSRLFGGRRFAAFPVFVALAGGLTAWALSTTGTAVDTVAAGAHVLVLLFGLQTGTVGLVGRDAVKDLLGDVTLVLHGARALPISERRLLALFVLKDVAYYAVFVVLPLAVAFAPLLAFGALSLLWVTLVWTFALGLCATLAGVALATRGRPGKALALALLAGIALAALAGVPVAAATPYAFFAAPSVGSAALAALPVVALVAVAGVAYDAEYEPPARTATDAFAAWRDRLPGEDPLLVKTLLDVSRSAGGVWKVGFSAAVLFVVSAFLVSLAGDVVGLRVLPGVAFGPILGLTAFTTYNWLTGAEDRAVYGALPVETAALFDAKRRAFGLLGVQGYLFGLTVSLAGFRPNEFLFDGVLFAAFTVGVAVPLVPVLVVGFVAAPLTPAFALALVVAGGVLAAAGHVLYARAVPKWTERLRDA